MGGRRNETANFRLRTEKYVRGGRRAENLIKTWRDEDEDGGGEQRNGKMST